jgi:anti-sigma factor RsiW
MDAENWTTEQIEAYLRQALPAPEQAKLKADLEQDEQLRAEVAAYQQVLEGLDALQEENFRAQLDSWSAATASNDQTELIAWYLEGQLEPEGQKIVEDQMATDPAFREEVLAYQQLISGMEAAQDEDFRSKLEEWEAGMAQQSDSGKTLKVVSRRPLWQYAAAAVGALLIALSTFSLYLKVNYSGPALSRAY